MAGTVSLRGFNEMQRAIARADKQVKKDIREIQKRVGEPVASAATAFAVAEITRVGKKWSLFRVGVTKNLIYVAPQQRGRLSRRNAKLRRPPFGTKLMEEAMEPALEQQAPFFAARVEHALDEMASTFYRKP